MLRTGLSWERQLKSHENRNERKLNETEVEGVIVAAEGIAGSRCEDGMGRNGGLQVEFIYVR